MKIKNNITFLTLLSFYAFAIFSAKPAEGEHVFEPIREQKTTADTSEHQALEQEIAEAEALRIRNLDDAAKILHSSTDNDTQSGSPHETGVAFSNPTTAITIDKAPDPLAGISPETLAKIRALNPNHPVIFRGDHTVDESSEEELKHKIEKVHAYEKIFEEELNVSQEKLPEFMRLTDKEKFKLKLEFIKEISKDIKKPETILAGIIAELLQRAKTLNEKHEERFLKLTPQEPMDEQPLLLPEEQKKVDDLAKIKESQEFKDTKTIILDFQESLEQNLTSLNPLDRLQLALERINPLVYPDMTIEEKIKTILKKAELLNAQRIDESKKAAKEQKAADEKAMHEEAARKAIEAEKERVQALKTKLIKDFKDKLAKNLFLTESEMDNLDTVFEKFVSINPDATDAIDKKSTELLMQAHIVSNANRSAGEERIYQKLQEKIAQQNKILLDTAIERISPINPKIANELRTLQLKINTKIPAADGSQMVALRRIIDTVINALPEDAPQGKNIFGKKTGKKWSKNQKKKAQEALSTANLALIEAFEEKATPPVSNGTETGITETQKAPQPDSKSTKKKGWLRRLFKKKTPKIEPITISGQP
jgi:hypothetical protein